MPYKRPEYKEWAPLPNATELTEEQFAKSAFFLFGPRRMFSAELEVPKGHAMYSEATCHHDSKNFLLVMAFEMTDGTGFAIKNDWHSSKVHYWRFGACFHEQTISRNLGRCYNEYTCVDCGYTYTLDSSD